MKQLVRYSTLIVMLGLSGCARFDAIAPPVTPSKPFVYQNVVYEHPAFALKKSNGVIPVGANSSPVFQAMSKQHQSDATDYFDAYSTCYYIKGTHRWKLNITNETYRNCGVMLDVVVRLYKEGYYWGQFVRVWGNRPFNDLVIQHRKCLEHDLNGNAIINEEGKLSFFCGTVSG